MGFIEEASKHIAAIKRRSAKEGDCQVWIGTLRRNRPSYVIYYKEDQPQYRHPARVLWEITTGSTLGLYEQLVPKCKNDLCISPEHQVLTSGRSRGGGRGTSSKGKKAWDRITRRQVEAIRFMYEKKRATQVELAAAFKVSQAAISRICSGETFKDDEHNKDI